LHSTAQRGRRRAGGVAKRRSEHGPLAWGGIKPSTCMVTPQPPTPAHLIKFLDVMRGTRMAAPTRLLPVMKMPLQSVRVQGG